MWRQQCKKPHDKKIDPALKFFYNVPLMLNNNDRIDKKLGNGTPCHGLYLVLKDGATMEKENWNGYYVNTIEASLIKYIVCSKKDKAKKVPINISMLNLKKFLSIFPFLHCQLFLFAA